MSAGMRWGAPAEQAVQLGFGCSDAAGRASGRRLADMISHDARTGMVSVDFAAFNATVPEEDA